MVGPSSRPHAVKLRGTPLGIEWVVGGFCGTTEVVPFREAGAALV
jgi:hypothetical protein